MRTFVLAYFPNNGLSKESEIVYVGDNLHELMKAYGVNVNALKRSRFPETKFVVQVWVDGNRRQEFEFDVKKVQKLFDPEPIEENRGRWPDVL